MRTPRVSAHPDLGQIAPLYPPQAGFVSDLAKIVDFAPLQLSSAQIFKPFIVVLNFALN